MFYPLSPIKYPPMANTSPTEPKNGMHTLLSLPPKPLPTNMYSRDYPPSEFDLIHTRVTIGCWADMKKEIIARAFHHLKPGGWLECQEVPGMPHCDDGTMPPDYDWLKWTLELYNSSRLANRQVDVGEQLKDWMREVGFVDVHEAVFKIPLNGWPKDTRLKHVGMLWQRNLLDGLQGFSLGFFSKHLGKTQEEIEVCFFPFQQHIFFFLSLMMELTLLYRSPSWT